MALTVNGETVPSAAIAREAEAVRQKLEQLTGDQREQFGMDEAKIRTTAVEWARENLIEQALMRQAAVAANAPLDREVVERHFATAVQRQGGPEKLAEAGIDPDAVRAEIEVRLRVDRLVARVTARVKAPRQKELARYYRKHRNEFRTEESVRAAHIVKHVEKGVTEAEAKEAAEALYSRLMDGADFAGLADSHSDCPGNGGDLGYFPRGQMVSEFEEEVFGLSVGQTSQVFQTTFGFHIAKVLDRKPGGSRPFREVQGEVRARLVKQRQTKALERYVDSLKARARIEG